MQTAVFTALGLETIKQYDHEQASGSHSASGGDDLYRALQGCGVGNGQTRGSVAILHSGGHGIGHMMIRRLEELAASLIEERWDYIHGVTSNGSSHSIELSRGIFQEENLANSLNEVLLMARKILLENVHVASPQDYDSLEHAVTYTLPALHEDIKKRGKAPLSLILIDDLPEIILDETERQDQKEFTKKRSRQLAELADRLKRLAMIPVQSARSQSNASAMAVVVVNHVVGLFTRNLNLAMPVVQDEEGESDTIVAAGPPPLLCAYQESYYDGSLINGDIALLQKHEREERHNFEDSGRRAGLGSPWVNCINVRIMMLKTKQSITLLDWQRKREETLSIRRAIGILNPFTEGEKQIDFVIRRQGFHSLLRCRLQGQKVAEDEEDRLWSSLEENLSAADMEKLLEDEERLQSRT